MKKMEKKVSARGKMWFCRELLASRIPQWAWDKLTVFWGPSNLDGAARELLLYFQINGFFPSLVGILDIPFNLSIQRYKCNVINIAFMSCTMLHDSSNVVLGISSSLVVPANVEVATRSMSTPVAMYQCYPALIQLTGSVLALAKEMLYVNIYIGYNVYVIISKVYAFTMYINIWSIYSLLQFYFT